MLLLLGVRRDEGGVRCWQTGSLLVDATRLQPIEKGEEVVVGQGFRSGFLRR